MYKKLFYSIYVLVLFLACSSQALVIGDFEGSLDGWLPAGDSTLTLSTIGATTGTGSMLIDGPGSWQMHALLDIKSLRSILGSNDAAISMDVTAFAEDMQTDWMNMEAIINGQNHDGTGANNNIGWQSLGGLDIVRDGVSHTLVWELPDDLSAKIAGTDDNIEWFELFIVTNNGAPNTKIYVDNIQLLGTESEPPASPILKLDVGNSHNPDELEEGFTSFTFADSGTAVNGITIEFGGYNAGDSRRRGTPTGVPYENIYRDFIFARQAEAGVGYVTVTLSGLEANQAYGVTLYSWDTSSTGLRITDWTANGKPLLTTMHDGSVNPPVAQDDYAFTGAATADANGVIFMEAVPGEGTFAAEPFGFINGLVLVPIEAILKLDVGNSHNAEELEDGFTSFTLDDSGSAVNGITIEFGGINPGDARRRGEPIGVPYENIYRDFIFGRQSAPGVGYVTVTLSGLQANATHFITLYSWDVGSKEIRIADWTGNGKFLFSTVHDGNVNPPVAEDDYAYTAAATADENGVILMEAVPGEGTYTDQPFAFINALEVSSSVGVSPGPEPEPEPEPEPQPAPEPVDPGTEGLIAYYAFENDVNDSSGNELHGTIVGDPVFIDGPVGIAMDFDGDYVDCGNSPLFDVTEQLTVAAWVSIRSVPGEWRAVIAKGDNAWRISTNSSTQGMHFGFEDGSRGWQAANSNSQLPLNEWHHVCGTYDLVNGGRIFIDGLLDGTNPDTGGITLDTYNVFIGDNSQNVGRFWDGFIDEVVIYDRALSAGEVAFLAGL